MVVTEIFAKSILNKSGVYDYCVNCYTGCQVNCVYCYARLFIKRFTGHKEPWGKFVDVKVNAPEVLRKQLKRGKRGTVWISSVCDPYQPLERRYRLTRGCLQALVEKQFPVVIQTKSALVLRDVDILADFEEIEVGFTITTDDEKVARLFEPGASGISERINALKTLHQEGIPTFAMLGPLLPCNPEALVEHLQGIADRVIIDRMNYVPTVRRFYHEKGLEQAVSEEFFEEHKHRLQFELKKREMKYELLY